MWQMIAWKIVVTLMPIVLNVTKGMFNVSVEAVKAAEADTNLVTGRDKKVFVMDKLVNYMGEQQQELPKRVLDALLVVAVNFVKPPA